MVALNVSNVTKAMKYTVRMSARGSATMKRLTITGGTLPGNAA